MNAGSLKHLFLVTTLKQDLSTCLIPVPVLSCFAAASLGDTQSDHSLFDAFAFVGCSGGRLRGTSSNGPVATRTASPRSTPRGSSCSGWSCPT